MYDLDKFLEKARCLESQLPVVFVDIEHAPLRSCVCRGLRLVNRRCNPVNVEDARKCQPAQPGTDDRDRRIHTAMERHSIYVKIRHGQKSTQRSTTRRIALTGSHY